MFSGLPTQQRINAPAAVDPVVDPTGVKGSQNVEDADLDDIMESPAFAGLR